MKRLLCCAAASLMVATAAHAGDMAGYEKAMLGLTIIVKPLTQVSRCLLRSPEWNEVMDTALQMEYQRLKLKYKIDPNDPGYDEVWDRFRKAAEPPAFSAKSCQAIVNSPVMDRLDAIEYKLTGGYH